MPITPPSFTFQALATSNALTTAFATVSGEINRLSDYLPAGVAAGAATAAATASTIPIRDTNRGFTVAYQNFQHSSATNGGIGMIGFGGQSIAYLNILASLVGNDGAGGTVMLLGAGGSKNVLFGGSITGGTVAAGGAIVTGASSIAGSLAVTGVASIVSVPQLVAAAPSAAVVPILARAFDTTPRKVISLQDSTQTTQDNGSLWSDGTTTLKNETWTLYAGNMSADMLFAGYVYPASPASLVVNVAPGSVWNGATWIENPAGGSITYNGGGANPALPVSNPRIDIIGFNASNAIAVVIGTEAASPAPPALPAAFTPLAYIKVRPGAAGGIQARGTTDTGTQSYIYRDIRANYVNPTGLGASGTFAPLTATYITDADESGAGLSAAKRLGLILAAATGVTLSTPLGTGGPLSGAHVIRSGWRSNVDFDADLETQLRNRVSYNLQSAPHLYCKKSSSTLWQLTASVNDPVSVNANGTWRTITSNITVSLAGVGAAGAYWIYADCVAGAGPGFTLGVAANVSKPAANSGQIALCRVYWDGAAIQDELVDYSTLGIQQLFDTGTFIYGPYIFTKTDTTSTTLSNVASTPTYEGAFALGTQRTIYLPRAAKVMLTGGIRFQNGTVPSAVTTMIATPIVNSSGANWPVASVSLPAAGVWDEMATIPEYGFLFGISAITVTIAGMLLTTTVTGNAIPIMTASWMKVTVT